MITIFNRKKLLEDTSPLELARVTEELKKNKIKYEVITKRNQSSMGMALHTSMVFSAANGGFSSHEALGNMVYIYKVYVSKKDYEKAKSIIL